MPNQQEQYHLPPITLLAIILELAIILGAVLLATHNMLNLSPLLQWSGPDLPLVTHGAGFAARIFQETGAIPLWNPFIGNGEPMLESAQAFLLNPLMSGPILLFGSIVGTKVGILLHIVIMGFGGWTLARMLGLRWAGRIMMGVFMVGSGSTAAPMGRGLYQLALSQTYMPWIFAGLIGMLYTNRRWCVGLFVVATMLLVFAGTFWYALPAAISCAILSAFALNLFTFDIDRRVLRRLLLAALFIAGLCAIRILPLERDLLHHPFDSDPSQTTFIIKASTYFSPITISPEGGDWWMNFHYVLPAYFGILIAVALAILLIGGYRREALGPKLGRIVVPAILIIGLFTLWGQGETDFKKWVYEQLPVLNDWRNTGRIAAAASLWVIVIAAISFDTIINFLSQSLRSHESLFDRVQLLSRSRQLVVSSRPLIAIFLVAAGLAALDLLGNWDRFNHLFDVTQPEIRAEVFHGEADGLAYLRARFPDSMLLVQTQAWVNHFGFLDTLTRYVFGDADVFTKGLPSTIGTDAPMRFRGKYAVGINFDFLNWLKDDGFIPFEDAPRIYDIPVAWYNPSLPPYAFWVPSGRLTADNEKPLADQETHAVSYVHHINSIDLIVSDYPINAVLVVSETDYPGWTVTINGNPATVESISGRLGVKLSASPNPDQTAYVTFRYQPRRLQIGAIVLFVTGVFFVLYLLRLDQRFTMPELWRRRIGTLSQRAITVLTTPREFDDVPAKTRQHQRHDQSDSS